MKHRRVRAASLLAALLLCCALPLQAGEGTDLLSGAVELFTLGDIYLVQYERLINGFQALILGAIYQNTKLLPLIDYPGSEQHLALEIGYRRYLWRGLHAEIQLNRSTSNVSANPEVCWRPDSDSYSSSGSGTDSILTWGVFPFSSISSSSGGRAVNPKPQSFVDVDGGDFYLSPVPMILVGLRL
jgi:hypothetical protein